MSFNGDLSKIPLPSYPLSGLNELIDELPQTNPAQVHSLPHCDTRHEAVSKVLTTSDPMLVTQIADAFSNPIDHRSMPLDSSQIEGVSRQALMHGIVPNDVYGSLMHMQGTTMPHVAPFIPPNPVSGSSMPALFPNEPVSNSRIYPGVVGNPNRSLNSRPVLAVAPQPRNPQVSGKMETMDINRPIHEPKTDQGSTMLLMPEVPQQPENPKICLKIKRTKKGHKEKKHSNKHTNEYGVVASETKPAGAGPIKLKISRVRANSSSSHLPKGASTDQTFTVSSMTTNEETNQKEIEEEKDSSRFVDIPFHDNLLQTQLLNSSIDHPSNLKNVSHKAKTKTDKHSHKHHRSSKTSGSSPWIENSTQPVHPFLPKTHSQTFQQDNIAAHTQHNKIFQHLITPVPQNNSFISSERSKQSLAKTTSTVTSNPLALGTPTANNQTLQQNTFQTQYMSSGLDQSNQQFAQQQPLLMLPYQPGMQSNNPMTQFSYRQGIPHGFQNQSSHLTSMWETNKQSLIQSQLHQQTSTLSSNDGRPPPYSDALMAQHRHEQLYPLRPSSNIPSSQKSSDFKNKPVTKPMQQHLSSQNQHSQQHQQHHYIQQYQSSHLPKHQSTITTKVTQHIQQPPVQQQSHQLYLHQQQSPTLIKQAHPVQSMSQLQLESIPLPSSSPYQQQPTTVSQQMNLEMKNKNQVMDSISMQSLPHTPSVHQRGASKHRREQFSSQKHNVTANSSTLNEIYMDNPRNINSNPIQVKPKKKASKHIRVKFIADQEEADIYKLKDIMYPDDTEVASFDELQPGEEVIAKWPMNGKMYNAVVVDPLENTGRKFRERKPPPKPYQVQFGSSRDKRSSDPAVLLNKLDKKSLPLGVKLSEPLPEDPKDGFNAYISMADRIKLKKRERLAKEARNRDGKKRKREENSGVGGKLINVESDESDSEFSPAKKRSHQSEQRKRERRRLVEMRFSQEDGAGTVQRLLSAVQDIFEDIDSIDPRLLDEAANGEKDPDVPQCLLISRSKLKELNAETAKLKAMDLMSKLPRKVLVRLMTILEPNVKDGANLKPMRLKGNTPEEQKWNRECCLDRVNRSTEAALVVMHIMTAHDMPKAVYIDDVIERTVQLLRQQLKNTIYPEYDPVYKSPSHNKKKGTKELSSTASTRMKRAHFKGPKNRSILQLYNKLNILLHQMVELVDIQPLTDTSILQISSLGISPFFVENVRELQLSAIRLTTAVFSRYDKHRSLILEDIFQSLARLPTSKRNLRNYRLTYAEEAIDSSDEEDTTGGRRPGGVNSGELQHIQMMTALVLQMIHAIAHLPLPELLDEEMSKQEKKLQHQVDEMKVIASYDTAVRTGQNFLSVFLKKCASKSEEIDYRPLFENLIHDLLATVNKPEWPASEMLLSVLGRLLVHTFSTKSTEMSLRVAALDYLGVVAAKLRRDAVSSITDVKSIQALLTRLEEATGNSEHANGDADHDGQQIKEEDMQVDEKEQKKKNKKTKKSEDDLTSSLQYLLLGHLRRNAAAEPSFIFAHNFYIAQWLRDVSHEFQQLQLKEEQDDIGEQMETHSRALQACQAKKDKLMEMASSASMATLCLNGQMQFEEGGQTKLLNKISPLQKKADKLAMGLTVEDAALVSRHLASSRSFSRAFDRYLSYILRVRDEPAVALRTRAIKCLTEVVAVDPSIMEREDIAQGVQSSLVDASTSVREASIDLVGKFILLKPGLVKQYYNMLTARILDTGVSVRKRVIKILRDLCHEYPDLPQMTDACVKMIRRVNDEEGIKKLVHEVFMKMWFSPIDPHDSESLRKRALLITDIVAANKDRGYEWIEQLFKNLIDTTVRNPQVELACKQIVDCLVEHVILSETPQNKQSENSSSEISESESSSNIGDNTASNDVEKAKQRSIRLVATVQTLVQLAKIRPRLLVPHVMMLQPFLATKCETADDVLTIHGVCRTLELAIPLMEHPSEAFLASIEEDMMRMILTHRFHVVSAAVCCLGAVTCRVTHNYRLIWDCFQRMCNGLNNARMMHEKKPESLFHPKHLKQLFRTLFIIGHFCKNFDFDDEVVKGKTQINVCVKDKVYDCLFYFSSLPITPATEELCGYSIAALGLLMVQDPNMMFRPTTRDLYKTLLDPNQKSDRLKKQVLQNLQNYLQTEDIKMQEAAEASAKKAKHEEDRDRLNEAEARAAAEDPGVQEDIKEICDVSSGMASSVMQLFLKQVLEAFFHRRMMVRHAALHTIYLTLQQGLVHPVQCVPYLIAASSDPEPTVYKEAEQQLVELNKRYHGFVHTKALQGIRLAYQLQTYVQPKGHIVRGYHERTNSGLDDGPGTNLKASCSQLYQLVRSDRKHRRALLLSLLNMFDDTIRTDLRLLVFVADNLAYFPYYTLDEPLHLISQIEVYVSVSGSNVLQTFKEALQSKKSRKAARDAAREEKRAEKLRKKEERKLKKDTKEKTSDDSSSSSSSSCSSSDSSSSSEGDDSDEEGSILSRLPAQDETIEEFASLSLACLLLLWLKQHLKTLFGFTDNKIHRYTPTEVNRANDKQCHRRRPDLRFNPKSALEHIDRMQRGVHCRDPEYLTAVINQYDEFNELMNKLDPNDEDSDSDREKNTSGTKNPTAQSAADSKAKEVEDMDESDRDTDGETKPAGTLDMIRKSTALKNKKSKKHDRQETSESRFLPPQMRERPPVKYMESSSESEEEFRGF